MKIKITKDDSSEEFSVADVKYDVDEWGYPVDICIAGTEDVLLKIAEYSAMGYNIQPNSGIVFKNNPAITHEALYARLHQFEIINN